MHGNRIDWPCVLQYADRPNEAHIQWEHGMLMDDVIIDSLQQRASREERPWYETDMAAVTEAQGYCHAKLRSH